MSPQRLAVLCAVLSTVAPAQWLNYSTPGTPRTPDGKPTLAAPTPRAPDGKPDLTGVWMHETTTVAEVKRLFGKLFDADITLAPPGMEIGTQHKYAFNILLDFAPGESPMRPETAEIFRQRLAAGPLANFREPCVGIAGIPVAGLVSEPIKIVQAPRLTMVLYEVDNLHRQIFTDGRKLLKEFDLPAYLGYSVGHWERDTFVGETAGFNDKTSLAEEGHPHSYVLSR